MKVLSKKTGIIYENIVLVKFLDDGMNEEIVDTETVDDVDFKNYDFAYTCLCDDCIELANKQDQAGCEGGYCSNEKCNSNSKKWEVIFSKEEIHNDFVAIIEKE